MPNLLDEFGVTPVEEQVYRAILAAPEPVTVDALRAALDLPERVVRECAERLRSLGFLHSLPGARDTFAAPDPRLALSVVIGGQEHRLRHRLRRVAALRAASPRVGRELASLLSSPHTGAGAHDVFGSDAIAERVTAMTLAATTRLRRLDHTLPDPTTETGAGTERLADDVRALYPTALARDPATFDRLARRCDAGEVVRLVPSVPTRLLIVDDCQALVTVDGAGERERALLVEAPPFLRLLALTFDAAWDTALPFAGDPAAEPESPLAPEEQRLLALHAAGLKDIAIARRLGIGLRTVVRRTGHLLDTLGAETRFQAGIQASRRGLL